MTKLFCDRCNREINCRPHATMKNRCNFPYLALYHCYDYTGQAVINLDDTKQVDLCQECEEELQSWLMMENKVMVKYNETN